jgi:hypothetical protein
MFAGFMLTNKSSDNISSSIGLGRSSLFRLWANVFGPIVDLWWSQNIIIHLCCSLLMTQHIWSADMFPTSYKSTF